MLEIRNVSELFLPGGSIQGAWLRIENGRIADFGANPPPSSPGPFLDAKEGAVVPGLIDSHTHLVFAGSREDEFVMRAKGMSYLEIAKAGGGIGRTVAAVRKASLEELVALTLPRLRRMLSHGVTTAEVKSGYGLNVEDEIKMLEAVRRLNELQPIELVPTLLAAHTVPSEYRDRREAYVDLVVSDELMDRAAGDGLAEFVDVFCEESAFTVPESRRILTAGKDRGLAPKIHADQITQMGASRLAAELRCVSAEHLEHVDEGGIEALREASVIAGILPGCSFYLGVPLAPVRRLMDAGIPIAIATDYNPGSSMIESLPLVLSIACTQAGITPREALLAATVTAAAALLREKRIGRVRRGLEADLVVLDAPSVDSWLSQPGRNCVRTVIKKGTVVHERAAA
jgi:imidazolonepropionase